MSAFTFSGRSFIGDLDIDGSLDKGDSRRQFEGLLRRKPTLEVALEAAGIQNVKSVLSDAMEFAEQARKDPEIAALGLSEDEAAAISCYTLQCAEGIKSPYEIITRDSQGPEAGKPFLPQESSSTSSSLGSGSSPVSGHPEVRCSTEESG